METESELRANEKELGRLRARVEDLETQVADLSARLRFNAEPRESDWKLKAPLSADTDALYLARSESGEFLDVNDAFLGLFGYSREELIGKTALEAGVYPDPEARLKMKAAGAAKGYLVDFRGRARKKSGETFRVSLRNISFVHDGETYVAGAVRDRSEESDAEEKLRASEEKFARFFRSNPAALSVATVFNTPRMVEVNEAFERIFGYTREECVGNSTLGLWADKGQRDVLISRLLAEGHVYNFECRLKRRNGETFTALLATELIEMGGEVCFLGATIDISEREKVQEKLRASEQFLKATERIASIGNSVWDVATDTSTWSEGIYTIVGWQPDEPAPTHGQRKAIYTPESWLKLEGAVGRALSARQPYDLELQVIRRDGQVRWVQAKGNPVLDAGGAVVRLEGTLQDITDRKQAEQQLAHSNLRLNLAIASGQLAVWELDPGQDLLFWDERMYELYGVSALQFGSNYQSWANAVHPEDRAQVEESIAAAMRGERPYEEEFRVVHPDGGTRYIKANGLVVRDDQGRAVRIIGLNRDITALKRSELEREELSAQLAQAQKMESIGRLAGGVAHDFNNLLTVINGHSRMALRGLSPGERLHFQLEQIQKAGERAAVLTRQLLAFSRKQILQPAVLHLNGIVKDIESILRRLVGEDVEIHVTLSPKDPGVHADPHQLEQVLMNLAVNARDAMPNGGTLFIETDLVDRDGNAIRMNPEMRPGPYAVLAVSDTGVGMDAATRARIFEPFFTTKAVGEGTGLGLSTVQGIVSQSGGYVNVYSEPGKGSTFRIYLPALAEAGAIREPAPALNDLTGRETVLVVEDQDDVREFTVSALQYYGYRVLEARNGQEALTVCELEHFKVDLLLTDVVMPVMSGPEIAARMAKAAPEIKTLFMSGYTENIVVRHGLLGGHDGLIQKPFTPDQLAASVRSLLGAGTRVPCILLAEPEARVRFSLQLMLEGQGYIVREVCEPGAVLEGSLAGVDMVVIATGKNSQREIDVIRTLRRDWPAVRILALALADGGEGPADTVRPESAAHATLRKPVKAELLADTVSELLSGDAFANQDHRSQAEGQ